MSEHESLGPFPMPCYPPKETTNRDAEADKAYRHLRRLFESCASPECTPNSDLLGLCMQIDNLIAGYRILLQQVDHTLSVHGKIDAGTSLHDRVRETAADAMEMPGMAEANAATAAAKETVDE